MSVLQDMIAAATAGATAIQASVVQIQAQIDDFQAKQDAMQHDVGDVTAAAIETYLTGTKFTPNTTYHMMKGSNFNQILVTTGNITDWKIYKIITPLTNLTYVGASIFECDGDKTTTFTVGLDLSFLLGTTRAYSTIFSSTLIPGDPFAIPTPTVDKTQVVLDDAILDATLVSIWSLHYVYSAGNDTTIDGHKVNWDFAQDYITHPSGVTGTYGTQANIASLTSAIGLLGGNSTKLTDSVTIFSHFVP